MTVVVLAPVVALAAWSALRVAGVELAVSEGDGVVGPADVFVAALAAGLAAWGAVRLLERHTRQPALWWPFVGSTALSISMVGPGWLADDGSAIALAGLHALTAVPVIVGFARTLPPRRHADCHPLWPSSDPPR